MAAKDNTMVITRKIALIPVASERKEWKKRINTFLEKDFPRKIEAKKKQIKNTSKPEKKDGYKQQLAELEKQYEDIKENGIEEYTQKMVNDYTYGLVRDAMESEARRKNYILSYIYTKMVQDGVGYMSTLKDKYTWIKENINVAYRRKGSNKGSIFDDVDIDNPLGGYGTCFSQILTRKIKDLVKQGLLDGKVSVPNFKIDSPFTIAKAYFDLYHEYEGVTELKKNIYDSDCKLYCGLGKDGHPTIANFKVNIGHKGNREELIFTLLKIFTGEYEICGSTMQVSKTKIILNLSIRIPKTQLELDENTVVGVDLGVAIPAVCSLNNNKYKREYIGSSDDFIRMRTKLQHEKRQLQKALKMSKGGHGRKRKLLALERCKNKEYNFVETYCHKVSKKVVDFAVKNKAKYINVENLSGYDSSKFILRNWSFYKLQQYIEYKAAKYGIEVRKVNPSFTSQVCSFCGHWEDGQRKDQAIFVCGNPDCESHKLHMVNADYNASRNIAMSTLFTSDKFQFCKKTMQDAAEYYGIQLNNEDQLAA